MFKPPDTTAVVVNYFSFRHTLRSVRSILESPSTGQVRVFVVDNSNSPEEVTTLKKKLPADAELIVNKENKGFGRACNQVFDQTESNFFLLLNPDALLIEDALKKMQQTLLDNPSIGAVSPQAFWDDEQLFFIPPAHPPFLFFIQPELLQAGTGSCIYSFFAWLWRSHSIRVWTADKLVNVGNICGGHVLLRREAVLKSGGLFDPRFFVYFEDADLFIRMRRSGYSLALQPDARAIHYYNQCDPGNLDKKSTLMQESYNKFVCKHQSRGKSFLKFLIKKTSMIGKLRHKTCPQELDDLVSGLDVPKSLHDAWLLEWSPNPDFIPAVGFFGNGPDISLVRDRLEKLEPGESYLRFGHPGKWGRVVRSWKWVKE